MAKTPHNLLHTSTLNVGDVVRGRDVAYQPFEEAIESIVGPYTVMVGGKFTPTSLIDEVVLRTTPPYPHQPGSSLFDGADAYEAHQAAETEVEGGVFD